MTLNRPHPHQLAEGIAKCRLWLSQALFGRIHVWGSSDLHELRHPVVITCAQACDPHWPIWKRAPNPKNPIGPDSQVPALLGACTSVKRYHDAPSVSQHGKCGVTVISRVDKLRHAASFLSFVLSPLLSISSILLISIASSPYSPAVPS
jgi:hypothetical protein